MMIGGKGATKSKHAWRQVYRALEHGTAKNACKNTKLVGLFPRAIEDFANRFVVMQFKRHAADYDPYVRFTKAEALQDVLESEGVIERFLAVDPTERRAFAAHVLLKHRES